MTDAASSAPASAAARTSVARLSRLVLARVFFRSLFLQASWNPQGMQNLGLAYALYPALRALYPAPDQLQAAVRRHLALFNTHPYVAAGIVGGCLYHEQRAALGEEPPEQVIAFKAALMGPLAALGDGFFWLSLKPAVGAFSAATVPWLRGWSAVLFLVLYNLVHLSFRARLFWVGYDRGDRLVEGMAKANLPRLGARLRVVSAACAGGVAAALAFRFGAHQGGGWGAAMAAGCLGFGGLSYWLATKRFTGYALLYLAALLATATGALL